MAELDGLGPTASLARDGWKPLLAEAGKRWGEDRVPRLSAALAFFTVLSLSPLLLLAVAIGSSMLGEDSTRARLFQEVRLNLGLESAKLLDSFIVHTANAGGGYVAGLVSLAVAIFGASNLFIHLEDGINGIWRLSSGTSAIKRFLLSRMLAILMVLCFALLVFAWTAVDSWLGWRIAHAGVHHLWRLASIFLSFFFMLAVSSATYRSLPRNQVQWSDTWPGAIVTSIGFVASKFALSLYFAFSSVYAAYGSAGALVVVLLWVYYTAQIFFFGLEVTYVYAHRYGSRAGSGAQ